MRKFLLHEPILYITHRSFRNGRQSTFCQCLHMSQSVRRSSGATSDETSTKVFSPLYDILNVDGSHLDPNFASTLDSRFDKLKSNLSNKDTSSVNIKDESIKMLNYIISRSKSNELRSRVIDRICSEKIFIPLIPYMYIGVFTMLMSEGLWKEIMPTHFKIYGLHPLDTNTTKEVFAIFSLYGEKALSVAKGLYNALPVGSTRGLLMQLLPIWKLLNIDMTIRFQYCLFFILEGQITSDECRKGVFIELNHIFDYVDSTGLISPDEQFVDVFKCYLRRHGLNLPLYMMNFFAERTAKLGKKGYPILEDIIKQIHTNKYSSSSRKKALLSEMFWCKTVKYHRGREPCIRSLMKQLGYEITPRVERAFIIHRKSLKSCETLIKKILNKKAKVVLPRYYGHYLSLVCKEQPGKAFETINKLEYSALKNTLDWYNGILLGFIKEHQYDAVIKIHKAMQIQKKTNSLSWNLAVSAYAISDRPFTAVQTLKYMQNKRIEIHDRAIADTIIGLMQRGRNKILPQNDHRHLFSLQLSKADKLLISEVIEQLEKLAKNDVVLPQTGLKYLILSLSDLNIRFNELVYFLLTLSKISKHAMSGKDQSNGLSEFTYKMINDISNSKTIFCNTAYYFDESVIDQLIYLGFKSYPTCPWIAISVLRQMKDMGIHIETEFVRHSVISHINRIYSSDSMGSDKMIREQLPPINQHKLVENLRQAWANKKKIPTLSISNNSLNEAFMSSIPHNGEI